MTDKTAFSISFDGSTAYAQAPGVAAYDFGVGDFTIEAWVRTKTGGPVAAQMGADTKTGAGWGLFVLDDGRVQLTTFDNGSTMIATTKAPPATFDGSWHHLAGVRVGLDMMILFDGVPQLLSIDINGAPPIDVSGNLPLTIGATALIGSQTKRQYFAGDVDEVRLWNTALETWQIDQNIYHIVTINRKNLVAQYGFDKKTGIDTSGKGNDLTFHGSVLFADPAFYFVPEGQPFMAVQVRLMEDYHYDKKTPSKKPTPVKAIRVALSPRKSNGQKRAASLTLTTDIDTSIYAAGAQYPIGPKTPVTLKTNADNQLNTSIFLDSDSLVAPVLKVHADFMGQDERIVVPLDRQIHYDLSKVTGPALQDPADPLLAPADFSPTQAQAVADTVSNVMSAAVQHDMQPSDPVIRSKGAPISVKALSTRRAINRNVTTGRPERENYLPVEMENPLLVPTSDLLRCHYMAQNAAVERVVIPTFMDTPHFKFDVKNKTFTPVTQLEAEAEASRRRLSSNFTSISAPKMADGEILTKALSAASLWDKFVSGLLDVTDWLVSIGKSILDGIRVVISYVEDGITKFFDFVVATVTEAAEFVVGMFRAIGVALQKVIDYLSALFNVADILRTHRVVYKFMQETGQFGLACVTDLKSSADAMFDNAKSSVDTYFDDAIAKFGKSSVTDQSQSSTLDQPASLQSDYVNQHVAETDMAQPFTISNVPPQAKMDTSIAAITAGSGPNLDTLISDNQAGITDFIDSAETSLDEALATILELLKASLDMAIDLAKAVVDAVLDMLIAGYQMVLDMIDSRINIPIITWFYEEVICAGDGSKLTILNLLALAGALPVTVLSKLFHGEAPFTEAFEKKFQTMSWQDYGFYHLPSNLFGAAAQENYRPRVNDVLDTAQPGWVMPLSWAQGFVFSASVAVWFGGVMASDTANVSVLENGFNTWLMLPIVGAQFLAQIASYPIYMSYNAGTPPSLEVSIWALQWLPFAMDVVDLVLAKTKPAGAGFKTYIDTVQNGVIGVWGVIHVLLFIALLIWETIENSKDPTKSASEKIWDEADIGAKGGSNIASTIPEIVGFARYGMANPEVKAAVVAADFAAMVVVPLVTTGRTIGAIVRHATISPR